MLERQTNNLRKVAMGAGVYSAAAFGLMAWPASGWIAAVMAGLYVLRNRGMAGRLTSHGSARWASRNDLKRAGMLNAKTGLTLGRTKQREIIRLHQAVHTVMFAPSGAGKTTSGIIPFLLQSAASESAIVTDFKGEIWDATAKFREKVLGHHCVLLDPFKTRTQTPDSLDPIDLINKDDAKAIDDCRDLANALVVRTSEEKDPHFNDSAEFGISAVAAVTVACGIKEVGTRSTQMMRETLADPRKLDMAIEVMKEKDCWGGALAQMGHQFANYVDKERSSVLTTINRHTAFLGSPMVMESTRNTSFDPSQLRRGKMTIYLIIPPERAQAQAGLLRMWITTLMRACVREGME